MREPDNDATQAVRYAIEFLTMYVSAGTEEERAEAADYISQRLTGSEAVDPIHVIRGQLYLGEILLLALVKAKGAQSHEYRTRAVEWLGAISPQLPE